MSYFQQYNEVIMNKIIISAAILAVILGGCRRQEAVPMKLGMEVPVAVSSQ